MVGPIKRATPVAFLLGSIIQNRKENTMVCTFCGQWYAVHNDDGSCVEFDGPGYGEWAEETFIDPKWSDTPIWRVVDGPDVLEPTRYFTVALGLYDALQATRIEQLVDGEWVPYEITPEDWAGGMDTTELPFQELGEEVKAASDVVYCADCGGCVCHTCECGKVVSPTGKVCTHCGGFVDVDCRC
jgi:hypothetical protein